MGEQASGWDSIGTEAQAVRQGLSHAMRPARAGPGCWECPHCHPTAISAWGWGSHWLKVQKSSFVSASHRVGATLWPEPTLPTCWHRCATPSWHSALEASPPGSSTSLCPLSCQNTMRDEQGKARPITHTHIHSPFLPHRGLEWHPSTHFQRKNKLGERQ